MAPIIPTHRPWLTPERGAIGVAALSLLCSVFLAVDVVQASGLNTADRGGHDKAACAAAAPAVVIASPGGVQPL